MKTPPTRPKILASHSGVRISGEAERVVDALAGRPAFVVGHPLLGVREALKVLVGVSSGHSPHRYDFSMPTAARRSTGARESRKRGHDEEPAVARISTLATGHNSMSVHAFRRSGNGRSRYRYVHP